MNLFPENIPYSVGSPLEPLRVSQPCNSENILVDELIAYFLRIFMEFPTLLRMIILSYSDSWNHKKINQSSLQHQMKSLYFG